MKILLKSMIIGLCLIAQSQAMDVEAGNLIPQRQESRELTPTEKNNTQKMMIINDALKRHEDSLKKEGDEEKDVSKGIGGKLHDLCANPVLDGELAYKGVSIPFKIRDLLKEDGGIDLSNPVFGDSSKYLLITTDPMQFFNVVENSWRLIILIAPKFLIEEKIESSKNPFQLIMANWDCDLAPIGIFYRSECWQSSKDYDYLTASSISSISKNNLYKNWLGEGHVRMCAKRFRLIIDMSSSPFMAHLTDFMKKISCSF